MMVRCMSPEMARNGPQAMSAIWSLTGAKRTWQGSSFRYHVTQSKRLCRLPPCRRGPPTNDYYGPTRGDNPGEISARVFLKARVFTDLRDAGWRVPYSRLRH